MGYRVIVLDPGRAQSRRQRGRRAHRCRLSRPRCAPATRAQVRGRHHRIRERPRRRLSFLAQHCVVSPSAHSVAVAQDRIAEKRFLDRRARSRAVRGDPRQESERRRSCRCCPASSSAAAWATTAKARSGSRPWQRHAQRSRSWATSVRPGKADGVASRAVGGSGARLRRRDPHLAGRREPACARHPRCQHRAGAHLRQLARSRQSKPPPRSPRAWTIEACCA